MIKGNANVSSKALGLKVFLTFERLISLTRARFSVLAQTEWMDMKRRRNWLAVGAAMLKASTLRKTCSIRTNCFFV